MSDASRQLLLNYRSKFYNNKPTVVAPKVSVVTIIKNTIHKNNNNNNNNNNNDSGDDENTNTNTLKYNYMEYLITILFGFIKTVYDNNTDTENDENTENGNNSNASITAVVMESLPIEVESWILDYIPHKMSVNDFQIIRIIGKGGYGEVRVAKYKHNGQIYAMKTLFKKKMILKKKLKNVKTERDLMVNVDHWLITRLFWSFQDMKYLYLVMEFCVGGDLMKILIKEDILSEPVTKFYMSECAVAIDFLHSVDYVHRDIKPDNILIHKDGHIKLTDFGLSKKYATDIIESKTNDMITKYQNSAVLHESKNNASANALSFRFPIFKNHKKKVQKNRELLYSAVGTPNYIAPEVFTKKGYGLECDFWSLGVITFECLIGYPPFYADTPINTVKRIVNFTKVLRIPKEANLSKEAKDFIYRLINVPQKRMTFKQIRKHGWLKRVPWKNMRAMQPPWIPRISSDADTRYFERVQNATDALQVTKATDPNHKPSRNSLMVASTNFQGFTFEREKEEKPTADSLFG